MRWIHYSFLSLIIAMFLGFVGATLFIYHQFTQTLLWGNQIIIGGTIGLIVISIAALSLWRRRWFKGGSLAFAGLLVGVVAADFGYQAHLENLEIASSQDIEIQDYRPFTDGNKVVRLEEEPELQLEEAAWKMDGATALYPVYAAFVEHIYPEATYPSREGEVQVNQTDEAFNRLLRQEADLVFMAEPSEKQKRQAEEKGARLEMTPIGREGFVFFVNESNPVEAVRLEDIQAIYSGNIENWKELGGRDAGIQAFQRPEGSGSQSALQRLMEGRELAEPPVEEVVSGMGGIIEETADYRNHRHALGFTFRYFSDEMVAHEDARHLAIDGVAPTKEAIQAGDYPLTDQFYAITTEENKDKVAPFIDWVQSEQGQRIIEKTGYVPLEEES
ncbi:PstS family phosphate ABC transporter substrate-binding protein [Salsuginibacillus kocurii]|uniref:PstS family phosphate ABC transporter substrate-binding protein n=1 Tax=Salsuginibacillus kocurii TaxID=427078 RepID=UPI00035FF8AD|nr:substrate-binding domain-containing protein [Salsuginibacillus kocurii]